MAQEKLAVQLARLKAQAEHAQARADADYEKFKHNREKAKSLNLELAAIERKVRNHRLIETGAIVEKIIGENVDKGILAGLIDKYKYLFNGSGAAQEIKIAGDTLISRWEEEKKAAKKKSRRKVEESNADGNE